jgi:hypothetical protein
MGDEVPIETLRFRWDIDFRGFTGSLFAAACRVARLPGGSDRALLPTNGSFYSRAFDGSVTLPAAGYNYGGN